MPSGLAAGAAAGGWNANVALFAAAAVREANGSTMPWDAFNVWFGAVGENGWTVPKVLGWGNA